MGMFDTVKVDVAMLPGLSDLERRILKSAWWQTKDFNRELVNIYITKEGGLMLDDRDGESGLILSNYNDSFNFYTDVGLSIRKECTHLIAGWYEFQATFNDGKLEKIERMPEPDWLNPNTQ